MFIRSTSATLLRSLRRIAGDLRALGVPALVWKDSDPATHLALPARRCTHGNAYCLAVKHDATRLRRCQQADDLGSRSAGPALRVRCCPFGVVEVGVRVQAAGRQQGFAWLGPWRSVSGGKPVTGCEKSWRALAAPPPRSTLLALGRLAQAALASALATRSDATVQHRSSDALMQRALHVMQTQAHPHLRAAQVAQAVNLSTSRFIHRFKAACGEGYRDRLRRLVIARAVPLLADPRRRVLDVALYLGYGDEDAFAAAFRRVHGLPPGRWRRRWHSNGA